MSTGPQAVTAVDTSRYLISLNSTTENQNFKKSLEKMCLGYFTDYNKNFMTFIVFMIMVITSRLV
jgi:hypothetical protein